jgi:hypothetical protein
MKNSLVFGYDSFIDRFTLVEEDTSEVIHEYYAGLANRFMTGKATTKFSLRNLFKFGNQMVDDNLEAAVSFGDKRRGLLQLRSYFHFKHFREGSDYEFGNDYIQSNTHLKLGKVIAGRYFLLSKSRVELLDYEKRTDFDYDYRYFDTGLGIETGEYFGRFMRISATVGHREAPDTTELSFTRYIGEVEGRFSFARNTQIDMAVSGDRRSYSGLTRSSYWNVFSSGGLTWTSPRGDFYSLRLESELALYDTETSTYFDNHFFRAGVRTRFALTGTVSLFVEPRSAWMFCGILDEEEYWEGSLVLGMDALSGESYWVTLSYEPGYRNYRLEENEIYSDFHINRLSMIGSAELLDRITLNLFVSHDPERHSRRTDDFSITLVSVSMSIGF